MNGYERAYIDGLLQNKKLNPKVLLTILEGLHAGAILREDEEAKKYIEVVASAIKQKMQHDGKSRGKLL